MKKFYVKESILNELKKGSYETRLEAVNQLANQKISEISGNLANKAYVVATFKEHAIIADNESNVYRLHLESKDGALSIKTVDKVESIERYTIEDIEKELTSDLKSKVVESFSNSDESFVKESFGKIYNLKQHSVINGYKSFSEEK